LSVLDKFPNNKRALDGIKALSEVRTPLVSASLIRGLLDFFNRGWMQELVLATDEAIKAYPEHIELLKLRSAGQAALGQAHAAIETYNKIIALDPTDADAYGNRGNVQKTAGQTEAARQSFLKVLEFRPRDATALNNIGNIHVERGELDEAQRFFETALEASPKYGPALNNLGNVLKIKGDTARAADVLSAAIEKNEATAEAYWNFASVKKFGEGAPEIEQMEQVLEQNHLTDREKMLIRFALGKAYEDIGDVERAFLHLSTANRLKKSQLAYHVEDDIERLVAQKAAFSHKAIDFDRAGGPAEGEVPKPVFIIGMPRSGTSLIEQMLSAHSDIHGGGEIEFLNDALSRLDWDNVDDFSSIGSRLRDEYIGHLGAIGGGAAYVTDKLPINFQWIGAIFSIFPDAKIVHVVRDARATCWSNFKHYYSGNGNAFAYDLDDVAAYYLAYFDLMRHWEHVFGDRIYRLNYDQFTADPDPFMRELLGYLELDWQDACLAPEKNRRAVYTSSATQVRRRIYQNSSRDWERFAELVGPAFDALP
jgi:tetratricopeptide (TPR) repeat protein